MIHHFIIAYNSDERRWILDTDLELDLFGKVGGTILDPETGKFHWSGDLLTDDSPHYDIDDKSLATVILTLQMLNEMGGLKDND